MQSDGNSISGDVVLDSFNRAFWDEYNKLDQIYKSKYVRVIFMMILILKTLYKNAYEHNSSLKTQFYELLVVMCCISLNMHFYQSLLKNKIFMIKIPRYLFLIFLL